MDLSIKIIALVTAIIVMVSALLQLRKNKDTDQKKQATEQAANQQPSVLARHFRDMFIIFSIPLFMIVFQIVAKFLYSILGSIK